MHSLTVTGPDVKRSSCMMASLGVQYTTKSCSRSATNSACASDSFRPLTSWSQKLLCTCSTR